MNIAIFNGGRGAKNIIKSLLNIKDVKITSIINTLDDGKSTGHIRNIFNMFGPSDLRKVQSLFLDNKNKFYKENMKIFSYRFNEDTNLVILNELKNFSKSKKKQIFNLHIKEKKKLLTIKVYIKYFLKKFEIKSHNYNLSTWSIMNIIYAGCFMKNKKNLNLTIDEIKELFKITQDVLPISNENLYLSAIRKNGEILYDEASIVEIRSNELIEKIYVSKTKIPKLNKNLSKAKKIKFLEKYSYNPSISLKALKAINNSDLIIYAPGTQHSSLLPTYLTKKLPDLIFKNKNALKVFITNIGADYETPNFSASDYINLAYKFLNHNSKFQIIHFFDVNFVNSSNTQKSSYVKVDKANLQKTNVPFNLSKYEKNNTGCHDGIKIRNEILQLLKK